MLALAGQAAAAQVSGVDFRDAYAAVEPTVSVSFTSATQTVTEGWTVDVMVTLDADPERTVTIPIKASPAAPDDYSLPRSVTFAAGETQRPINFATVDDTAVESAETYTLSLGSALPTGVNAGTRATSDVTVMDDDAPDPNNLELGALAVTRGAASMYPVFNPRVHHYAIHCPDNSTLRVTATSRDASHELALNNIPVTGMSLDRNVLVNRHHDVAVRLSGGGESATYIVHCIPPNFPSIKITKKQAGVSDGLILLTPLRQDFPRVPGFMAVMDNNGVPRFVRDSFPAGEVPMNFQRHDTDLVINGRQARYSVTHYLGGFDGRHVVLDGSFEPIVSVETKRPSHSTNAHDFVITEDGTFLFSSRRTVSRTLGNGQVHNTYENIIEEVSPTGSAVWSWSSWDHLTIDPDCLGYDLGPGLGRGISAHINALTMIDGDVVASSRGCAQVIRIDRSAKSQTDDGTDLVWQLGGTDRGTMFPDDRAYLAISGDDNGRNEFCRQHHATETASGTVVLFDNGVNCLSAEIAGSTISPERGELPPFSRVVEYDIDTTAGTAAFHREFLLDRRYGHAPYTGAVDILDNGNWLFTWGYLLHTPPGVSTEERSIAVSEANSSGTELLRVNAWRGSDTYQSFRAYREAESDVEIPLNLPAIPPMRDDDDEPAPPPGPGGSGPGPGPQPEPEPEPTPEPEPEPEPEPPTAEVRVDVDCDETLCRALTGQPVAFRDASTGSVRSRTWDFGDGATSRSPAPNHAWTEPGFYEVTLRVGDGATQSTATLTFLVEAASPAGNCVADDRTRCLRDSRYAVTVDWHGADGAEGTGRVVRRGTDDSGLFQFFDRNNWEVLIKILDGCALNRHVWIFGASTTDLGYAIRVTDTATGEVRSYRNEPGTPAPAITDSTAFPNGCPP